MNNRLLAFLLLFAAISAAAYWLIKDKSITLAQAPEPKEAFTVQHLTLKGSNTVGESFAPELAKGFLKSIGASLVKTNLTDVPVEKYVEGIIPSKNTKIKIDIKAHGSSTGFKALDANMTEIAMSSRAIKQKELDALSEKFGRVVEHPIALDALAIVTYPGNPIESLTINQIAQLFSGEIDNWKALGGEDLPVKLFSRDNNSGTWDTFKSLVLKPFDLKLAESSARFESSNELVQNVIGAKGALGFVGVAYVDQAKLLKVSLNPGEQGSTPSGYTIGTFKYPLSRKLYFYTTGDDLSEYAQMFIDFVAKNEGQKLAEKAGLISYYPTYYRPEKLDKVTASRYRELAVMGKRITVNFSSNEDNSDEAKETRDIQRLKNYIDQHPHNKIVLVDFGNSPRVASLQTRLQSENMEVLDTLKIKDASREADIIEVWTL